MQCVLSVSKCAGQKKAGAVTDDKPETPPLPTLREFARAFSTSYEVAYRAATENPGLVVRVSGGRGPLRWSYRVANSVGLAAAMTARLDRCKTKTRSRPAEPRLARDPAGEVDHAPG